MRGFRLFFGAIQSRERPGRRYEPRGRARQHRRRGLRAVVLSGGVERGWMARADAVARTLVTLRFFWDSEQSEQPDATGYKGFYYHFLDMKTGQRVWESEVSLIDTTLLLAGCSTASVYFNEDTPSENEIRERADAIYRRIDWQWARGGGATVRQGWKPESGFLHYGWDGYDEATILYVLGLASPTHPLPRDSIRQAGPRPISGKTFTITSFFMPGRSSSIIFPRHGSIFPAYAIASCARRIQRLFRKQPARDAMSSANTRGAIRSALKAMARIVGALRRTTAPGFKTRENRRQGTPLSRLCRTRRALWARRRNDGALRDARIAAV